MATSEVFACWTIKDLQEYIKENGGNPDSFDEKSGLIQEATRICYEIERQVLSSRLGLGGATAATPSSEDASAPPLPGQEGGPAYGNTNVPVTPTSGNYGTPPAPENPAQSTTVWNQAGLHAGPLAAPAPTPYLAPGPMPSPATGRAQKRALLCGCNYAGAPHALRGCVNDVHCMAYLLKTKFGFLEPDIVILTDDQPVPQLWPTRMNMLYQIQVLVWNSQPGDSLFFHFSGHGAQTQDYSGDEPDGLNETLCPCDFKEMGMIVDDELNLLLINPLPPGARLHAVIDACHSGSVLDLEYNCKARDGPLYWKTAYDHAPSMYKGTAGGEVFQFGASRDKQKAADTQALSGYASTGAATFSFIQGIERWGPYVTYGQLLLDMTYTLQTVNSSAMPTGGVGIFSKVLNSALDFLGLSGQTPVLSSNAPFDMMSRPLCIL
eukprot:jgi/Botrbrau1/10451/Bobra.0133s0058.1